MLTTFFQVICSFKNRAAIMEITTGFKELIRDAREPDNRAVPPSCNMIETKYPRPPRISRYFQCSG